MVGAAASLAEAMLRSSAGLHVLATSREALRAEGEWIHRLAPMEVPETAKGISAAQAMAFPAVQLFVERAAASSDGFALCDDTAADVVALCRRLDGLPLAIELAAARVNLFGARQLAARLDDRLLLFGEGRRTALPRHQTLHATLEWSYGLLTAEEQAMLRAVSIYRAAFTVDCAMAMRQAPGIGEDAILAGVESLSAKSLLKIDAGGAQVKCRLLDSTRAFAFGKLREAGELPLQSPAACATAGAAFDEGRSRLGRNECGRMAGAVSAHDRRYSRGPELVAIAGRRCEDGGHADRGGGAVMDASVADQ